MFWCCCLGRLHRHQLHLVSYGFVSLSLIITGLVFTIFAVLLPSSQIGKVWLAGPVLIVVGAVLCGKVMIDWGPAMERGRADSVDSRLVDEFGFTNLIPIDGDVKVDLFNCSPPEIYPHHLLQNSIIKNPPTSSPPPIDFDCNAMSSSSSPPFLNSTTSAAVGVRFAAFDCITYSNNNNNNNNGPDVQVSMSLPCSKEMADKGTQAKAEGCEKCATLWAILDRRKRAAADNNGDDGTTIATAPKSPNNNCVEAKRPKVIGKFVFSEFNNHTTTTTTTTTTKIPTTAAPLTAVSHPNYGTLPTTTTTTCDCMCGGECAHQLGNPICAQNANADIGSSGNGKNNGVVGGGRAAAVATAATAGRRKFYSQGETMFMNERSFLI